MALPNGVGPGARGELAGDEGAFDDPAREPSAPETMERVGTASWSCGVSDVMVFGELALVESALGGSAMGELAWDRSGSRRASCPRLLALSGPGWVGCVVTDQS
ncbi:MAG: hypothetical protein IT432_06425 [Phycisphaerales bacterium]|nr:hypothetical protein [Phycisphaerales bacterium]